MKKNSERTYNYEADPGRTEHVINEPVLGKPPIVRHFAYLIPPQFFSRVNKSVHVAMQSLYVVYCFNVKLHFDEIFWICCTIKKIGSTLKD